MTERGGGVRWARRSRHIDATPGNFDWPRVASFVWPYVAAQYRDFFAEMIAAA